jgi:hypothetical protein
MVLLMMVHRRLMMVHRRRRRAGLALGEQLLRRQHALHRHAPAPHAARDER